MSDLIQQLQQSADAALKSENIEEAMKHLTQAFSLFSKEAEKLQSAYAKLKEQFLKVNHELEKTNLQLLQKVSEFDTVTHYLNNILKNISQGILFITLDGTISTCNEAAEKILSRKTGTTLFKSFRHLFPDDFFGFSMADALRFGLSQRLNYITLSSSEGQKREVEISTSFVYEGRKEYRGIIIMLRDITELQRLQLIAKRNDRMKELGEMAATVAHEIRNPLGGIRGYATLLHRDLEGSSPLQEMAAYIIEGTKALERLVSTVLHYARPLQIQTKTVDLASLLRKTCKFIKADPSLPEKVKIELHIAHEPLYAPIDIEAFRSALLNLILNAFQAMPHGGTLTLSLIKRDLFCVITISDNGAGIESKDLEQIFSPFFTTKKKGTGLGLSETYKIIQAHFGTIDVRSELHRGTTFTITLPLRR